MVFAAAARLGRRCNLFSQRDLLGRWLATQTTSAAQNNNNAVRSMPWLIVSSGTKPGSLYAYNLTSSFDNPKADHLKLDRELILPEIAENWIVGSSQGYLISIPLWGRAIKNTYAINPLTEDVLYMPPLPYKYREARGSKVILSPSLDMAVVVPNCKYLMPAYVHLPTNETLSSSQSTSFGYWNAFPLSFFNHVVSDCIFHKDSLCLSCDSGNGAIFDQEFFDTEGDPSQLTVACPFTWDYDVLQGSHGDIVKSTLMESHDRNDLYLIVRNADLKSLNLKVFKLDRSFRLWEEVNSIGDSVAFVGNNHAMSFPAHDFPLLQSNSIYFSGCGYGFKLGDNGHYTGVYYLEYHSFEFLKPTKDDHILALTDLPSIWLEHMAS